MLLVKTTAETWGPVVLCVGPYSCSTTRHAVSSAACPLGLCVWVISVLHRWAKRPEAAVHSSRQGRCRCQSEWMKSSVSSVNSPNKLLIRLETEINPKYRLWMAQAVMTWIIIIIMSRRNRKTKSQWITKHKVTEGIGYRVKEWRSSQTEI